MANANVIKSQTQTDDLKIEMLGFAVHFEGTSEQLIAEGLVPEGLQWPPRNIKGSWCRGGFYFTLFRRRPANLKVSKDEWQSMDNWALIRVIEDKPDWEQEAIKEKLKEIELIKFKHSAAGKAAFNRYLEAEQDAAFQAFKRLIPGLVKDKPARKPKDSAAKTRES